MERLQKETKIQNGVKRILRRLKHWRPHQQTRSICITFVQRRPNVFDVGPSLYKCYAHAVVFTRLLMLLEAVLVVKIILANMRRSPNVGTMLGQRRRRWTLITMGLTLLCTPKRQ